MYISVPMKPYIKGQNDNYFLVVIIQLKVYKSLQRLHSYTCLHIRIMLNITKDLKLLMNSKWNRNQLYHGILVGYLCY